MYQIKLVYKDGKEMDLEIPNTQYQNFFDSLNAKKVFWSPYVSRGFWTNLDDVRYIHVNFFDEDDPRSTTTEEEENEILCDYSD